MKASPCLPNSYNEEKQEAFLLMPPQPLTEKWKQEAC